MRKPCNECPFLKSSPLIGSPDWLKDIAVVGNENPYFDHSCHKTDSRADGYKGARQRKECVGHITMIMNEIQGTPGKGGVYGSRKELIATYLAKWLGKKELKKIINEGKRNEQIRIQR